MTAAEKGSTTVSYEEVHSHLGTSGAAGRLAPELPGASVAQLRRRRASRDCWRA
jgi:hypothetical protein